MYMNVSILQRKPLKYEFKNILNFEVIHWIQN